MFDKLFSMTINFLGTVATCGVVAIFFGGIFYLVLTVIFVFAMIPVEIIAGGDVATSISEVIEPIGFRIVYAITFISLVIDELDGQKLKQRVFEWWKAKKQ